MRLLLPKRNTQEKIKEATYELLAEKGYAALSMRDIAKRANTALGQLTYYYKTKKQLIISVIDDITTNCLKELEINIENSEDKLEATMSFFENLYKKDNDVFKIMLDFTAQSLWDIEFKDMLNKFVDKIISTITNMYQEIGYKNNNAKEEAEFFISAVYGVVVEDSIKKVNSYSSRIKELINLRYKKEA